MQLELQALFFTWSSASSIRFVFTIISAQFILRREQLQNTLKQYSR